MTKEEIIQDDPAPQTEYEIINPELPEDDDNNRRPLTKVFKSLAKGKQVIERYIYENGTDHPAWCNLKRVETEITDL